MTRLVLSLIAGILCLLPISAQANDELAFFTLGTGSGPQPKKDRAQPANLVAYGERKILVDVGDGAVEQLGKVGIPLEEVSATFISHLHFDHTGGLFALISRRYQILAPGKLRIFGPAGTKATVDALIAAMQPAVGRRSNIGARAAMPVSDTIEVIEISDGWSAEVSGVLVTAASNSHYVIQARDDPEGSKATLSFRFETPNRSIVYTGDTGPSENVVALSRNADLLVAELMDPDFSIADLRAQRPDMPEPALNAIAAHFNLQHLSPYELGLLAQRANVSTLVITHNAVPDDKLGDAEKAIGEEYSGQVIFASDLDRF